MLFALVGLPNKGKTTLFNALTHASAQVADYPFTTIDPNKGVAFASAKCPCSEKGAPCRPRNSKCSSGTRLVPVNVIDVAGLVDGAHEGRGRGNQFLNDLSEADALVCVADASGSTDSEGNKCAPGTHDPREDVLVLEREIDYWLAGIAKRNAAKAKGKTPDEFQKLLAGLKVDARVYAHAAEGLPAQFWQWTNSEFLEFARRVRLATKPLVVAANKCDLPHAREGVEALRSLGHPLFEVYADYELALQKARERGLADYDGTSVTIKTGDGRMVSALEHIKSTVAANGTGVQALVDGVAFGVLDLIVAYPVQDEKKWTDNKDNLLPDALLLRRGSTAHDLAAAIHTDLAAGFLYAVDGRTHLRIAREQPLKDGEVVKVVSTR